MSEVELNNLELQVESLLQGHTQLLTENLSLRQKISRLTQERAKLIDKNRAAVAKIKRIIAQLRSEMP